METTDFLIVGAGLAGITAGADLQARGATVRLLDKGRGVGGRMATRRWGGVRVDHGAQYFTARSPRLQSIVAEGISDGWLREWCKGYPAWENGQITARPDGHPRYAPPNGMSELPKRLSVGLDIVTEALVTGIVHEDEAYVAHCADGRTFAGKRLIFNLPPTQLLAIAPSQLPDEIQARLAQVEFAPAWTLMLRLEEDVPGADWPGLEIKGHPVLGWMARDHTRRASADAPPVLVCHGTGDWSRVHLEDSPGEVLSALRAASEEIAGPLRVGEAQVHRWRYAQPTNPLSEPFFWASEAGIGGCGDWCAPGGRVEGAIESGWQLAAAGA